MKKSSNLLLQWFNFNKRDLPWRETKDPYAIWLSEIILQQTRIEQGTPYYINFLRNYERVKDLALAKEDEVLKLWQGLGYYSRARNLHKTAKIVFKTLNGRFPDSSSELKKLPGIGNYTSAAIASISFGEKIPVLDGNVYRVLSRLFDIDLEIGNAVSRKYFTETALEFMGDHEPGMFNQAMMEFGALHCTPTNPDCDNCILSEHCRALANDVVSKRPVIKKKKPIKNRYLNYFLIHDGSECFINKRSDKDIWLGLYDFPMSESSKCFEEDETPYHKNITHSYDVKHLLTHQRLHIRFFVVHLKTLPNMDAEYKKYKTSELSDLPVPKPIEKFIKHLGKSI